MNVVPLDAIRQQMTFIVVIANRTMTLTKKQLIENSKSGNFFVYTLHLTTYEGRDYEIV